MKWTIQDSRSMKSSISIVEAGELIRKTRQELILSSFQHVLWCLRDFCSTQRMKNSMLTAFIQGRRINCVCLSVLFCKGGLLWRVIFRILGVLIEWQAASPIPSHPIHSPTYRTTVLHPSRDGLLSVSFCLLFMISLKIEMSQFLELLKEQQN